MLFTLKTANIAGGVTNRGKIMGSGWMIFVGRRSSKKNKSLE